MYKLLTKQKLKILTPILLITILVVIVSTIALSYRVYAKNEKSYVTFNVVNNLKVVSKSEQQNYSKPFVSQKTSNTYEINLSGETVEIGSSNTSDFSPTIKFNRFNDASDFTLNLLLPGSGEKGRLTTSTLTGNTIKSENTAIAVEFLPTPQINGINELGGVDIVITLKESLNQNFLIFNFNNRNADMFLQQELTETEVNNGYQRPDYAINSIAIYSTFKDNEFGTGKIGHLYRERTIDSIGNWAYADWVVPNPNAGAIKLQFNETFMNTAVHPVKVEPFAGDTFGYTGVGASSFTGSTVGELRGLKGTAGSNGTIAKITAYVDGNSSADRTYKGIMVLASDKNILTNGVAGASANLPTTPKSWVDSVFVTPPSVTSGTDYFISEIFSASYRQAYDSGGAVSLYDGSNSYASPTNPTDGTTTGTNKYSIYATYTDATASLANSPATLNFGVVNQNSTVYADGSAPSNPVVDENCTFTITNDGSIAIDVSIKETNPTGGVGWTLTSGAPGSNTIRDTAYVSGIDPATGVVLTTSNQAFYSNLAASTTIMWDFKRETGTFTDGAVKTSTITLTAAAH